MTIRLFENSDGPQDWRTVHADRDFGSDLSPLERLAEAEAEHDRYREALEEIVKWSGADPGASKCASIAREALDG